MSAVREYLRSAIFLNDDINVVQAAYERVLLSQPDPALCREEIARYVLAMYNRGIIDPEKLERLATLYFRTKLRVG